MILKKERRSTYPSKNMEKSKNYFAIDLKCNICLFAKNISN